MFKGRFHNPQPKSTGDSNRRDHFIQRLTIILHQISAPHIVALSPSRVSTFSSRSLPPKRPFVRSFSHTFAATSLRALLCAALLLGLIPNYMESHSGLSGMEVVQAAPNACPASPSGLPDVIERTTFCVYYDDGDTSDANATTVADHTQDYWDLYISPAFGFLAPAFVGKLVVEIFDSAACNGVQALARTTST